MGSGGMMGGGNNMMGGGGNMMGGGGNMMGGGGNMMGGGGNMMGGGSMMGGGAGMMGGGGGMMGSSYGNTFENTDDAVVKLRGLPFNATKTEITEFFSGIEIETNGILIISDSTGRPKGEAFVQFTTEEGAKKALQRNKQNMGHRYIEVFSSDMDEARRAQDQAGMGAPGRDMGGPGPMRSGPGSRPGPYDRNGGMGGRSTGAYAGNRAAAFGDYSEDQGNMGAGMGPGRGMRGGMGGMGGGGGGGGGYSRGGRFAIKVGNR